jgi:hypothetical protein
MHSLIHQSDIVPAMSKQLTLRGVSDDMAARLESLAAERRQSVNATILELLERALGAEGRLERLRRYATWNDRDFEEIAGLVAAQRTVDDDLWR